MEEVEKAQGSPEQPLKGRAFSAQHMTCAALGRSADSTPVCLPCLDASGVGKGKGSGLYKTFILSWRLWGSWGMITGFQLTWILV